MKQTLLALATLALATSNVLGSGLEPSLHAQEPTSEDSAFHVLNRLAYGPVPSEIDSVARTGVFRWVDRQLAPDPIAESRLPRLESEFRIRNYDRTDLARRYLAVQQERRREKQEASQSDEERRSDRRERDAMDPDARRRLALELQQLAVVRAVVAENQLREVMADFWMNHFNVVLSKGADRFLLPSYIEETIRPLVLGRFEDLLIATAQSPAMLFYLDNARSVTPGAEPPRPVRAARPFRRTPRFPRANAERANERRPTGINENYARELLELHTLGVDGGYTQQDVVAVARILTGWGLQPAARGAGFEYHDWAHDRGEKVVLGIKFPAGHGMEEGVRLLKMLASDPATIHHVSRKLCARFVSDMPPDGCVDAAVQAWQRSGGEIREVVRAIVHTPEFWAPQAWRSKIKTPLEFVASALRAVGAVPDTMPGPAQAVAKLGQPLFLQPSPAGYPESEEDWVNSGALLNRMNVAVALAAGRIPGATAELDQITASSSDADALLDAIDLRILGGTMTQQTRLIIRDEISDSGDPERARAYAVGLALGSPEFQKQ